MKLPLVTLILLTCTLASFAQQQSNSKAFISISGTLGKHTVKFKDFAKSSGLSFGFNINVGIYAINNQNYQGGLVFTLLEGASREEHRSQLSEDFIPPYAKYDKHLLFKFAQFRSANIAWFSQFKANNNLTIYHQLGFGIFGTTERDQLLDFGLSNQFGFLVGQQNSFKGRFGISHDTTFGTGNPNYTQNNIGFTFGGFRGF